MSNTFLFFIVRMGNTDMMHIGRLVLDMQFIMGIKALHGDELCINILLENIDKFEG